jgi:hypothetical protein
MMIGFGAIGFAYGCTIAVYPAAISKLFGAVDGRCLWACIYGMGLCRLAWPIIRRVFDQSGYTLALVTAGVIGLISTYVISFVFKEHQTQAGICAQLAHAQACH